jgi:transcriptional regulator with XRE-family HTH domain
MCDLDIIDNIVKLMSERKITAAQLTREAGLSHGAVTHWKYRRQQPSADSVAKIATYFKVSVDELMGIENPATPEGEQPEPTEHQRLVQMVNERTAKKSVEALRTIIAMMDLIEKEK